jgi:hypothetical protein
MAITHSLNEGIQTFVYLRSSRVLFPCLYTLLQVVCYCLVSIPSFKPCIIAMFVYLRSSCVLLPCLHTAWTKVCKHGNNTRLERRYTNIAITHSLNEGIQTWQWHRIWTKIYKHGNDTGFERRSTNMAITSRVLLPCLYTFVQAVYYCHVCIPSFKPCVIAMFVYLRSRCVLLPCL